MAQTVKNLPAVQETWVHIPRSVRSPGEGNGSPLLTGEFCGQKSLAGYTVQGILQSQTQLSDFHFFFHQALGRLLKSKQYCRLVEDNGYTLCGEKIFFLKQPLKVRFEVVLEICLPFYIFVHCLDFCHLYNESYSKVSLVHCMR